MSNPGPASTSTTANLGGGSPIELGGAATSLLSVYDATPTSQASYVAPMTITGLSVSGVIGFASSAQFSAALTLLNALEAAMIAYGIMKAS